MTRNTVTFSDIDLNFSAHPVTGDITKRLDDSAINASIRNLVMTSNYERPFHSEIGSQVRNLLFEPASPISKLMLEKSISQTIQNFEPRVVLLSVNARFSPENNSVYVTVEYKIINTNAIQTVNLTLKRTR
ncbi:COG3628 Phage baseplate assembly protein W [uncultured Caudovirales phage]|uniref:COG3628 Phage baseplate assembly protein W n=1 Tax=uncultured Caudovirales phage TaxID=2100421 RepID=A0A6J5KW54_9CAUD|nr:COG3628 Phage baseplate assembly protein W [uncultured Caudovirales phage]